MKMEDPNENICKINRKYLVRNLRADKYEVFIVSGGIVIPTNNGRVITFLMPYCKKYLLMALDDSAGQFTLEEKRVFTYKEILFVLKEWNAVKDRKIFTYEELENKVKEMSTK